jgi:4-amino-4-deoxy-L-arabinose transferase-like glycosyltransferase
MPSPTLERADPAPDDVTPGGGAAPARSQGARTAWLVAALTAARLLLLPRLGLFNDEAYYWEWSRHLAASYYDHPPAVAWLIAGSTRLLGATQLAVHLPALVLSALTSLAAYRLARDLFPDRPGAAAWSVVALNVAPLFGLGAVFTTPDAPATLCWVVTTWLAWRAVHGSRRAWYAAGLTCGLGLLSKYTFVLLPLGLLAWLLTSRHRAWLRRREPWIAIGLAAALTAPVLAWNARHGWASFEFQLVARHLGPWQPWATLRRYLVAQQAISPPLWLVAAWAGVQGFRRALAGDDAHGLLWWTAAAVLGVFGVAALHTWVNPNWCGIGFLPLLLAAGALLEGAPRWVRVAPLALAALLTAAFYAQAVWAPLPRSAGDDFGVDLHGWDEVGARLRALRDAPPGPERPFVFATRFQLSAKAAFYGGDVEVTRLGGRRDAYDDWRDEEALHGRTGILLQDDRHGVDVAALPFARCAPAGTLPIVRGTRTLRTFTFWRCEGYGR